MVFIRADANAQIGAGHMMRCLTIAHAFVEKGETVRFITADHNSDGLIGGFDAICLNTVWTDAESELPKLFEAIKASKPSLVLIDSYCVTEHYFNELNQVVFTAYIDDLNAACWNVDWLINYNIFASVYDYSRYTGTSTRLLLEPRYAPLRKEFRLLPRHGINQSVTDILVSAGGADPEGITERMIREVCPNWPDIRFHFIVGVLNPRIDEIKKLEKGNVILHINERNMAELMMKCDIAISAAGITLYELCAAGTPTITYTLADNQIYADRQFDAQGLMVSAGDCRENDMFTACVSDKIQELDYIKRSDLSERMQNFVDGQGADRIVEALLA